MAVDRSLAARSWLDAVADQVDTTGLSAEQVLDAAAGLMATG